MQVHTRRHLPARRHGVLRRGPPAACARHPPTSLRLAPWARARAGRSLLLARALARYLAQAPPLQRADSPTPAPAPPPEPQAQCAVPPCSAMYLYGTWLLWHSQPQGSPPFPSDLQQPTQAPLGRQASAAARGQSRFARAEADRLVRPRARSAAGARPPLAPACSPALPSRPAACVARPGRLFASRNRGTGRVPCRRGLFFRRGVLVDGTCCCCCCCCCRPRRR